MAGLGSLVATYRDTLEDERILEMSNVLGPGAACSERFSRKRTMQGIIRDIGPAPRSLGGSSLSSTFLLGLLDQMPTVELLADAEQILEKALADYRAPPTSAEATEFYELRLQAAIFNYDGCRSVSTLLRDEPKGFALKVCLRDLVHKLYEYDRSLSGRLVKRTLELAERRGIDLQGSVIRAERVKWKDQLSKLQSWSNVRNQTAAHYGDDIAEQVRLIDSLDRDDVLAVARAFLSFNIAILRQLARVGRG